MDRSGTGISSAGSLSREETMALVDQEDLENGQWVSVSQNAYGAFIHVALQSGLLRACSMCLPMVGVSVFVQLVFSIQLFDAHRTDFDDFGDDICRVYYLLHIVSVLIFLIMMLNNIPSMVMAGVITLASTHHKRCLTILKLFVPWCNWNPKRRVAGISMPSRPRRNAGARVLQLACLKKQKSRR